MLFEPTVEQAEHCNLAQHEVIELIKLPRARVSDCLLLFRTRLGDPRQALLPLMTCYIPFIEQHLDQVEQELRLSPLRVRRGARHDRGSVSALWEDG